MKLGAGAKAGLASGIILLTIYGSIKIIAPLAIIVGIYSSLLYYLEIIPVLFFEGYYGSVIRQIRVLQSIKPELLLMCGIDIIFILIFLIYILFMSIALGGVFQAIYTTIPFQSNARKGPIYGFAVWFILGIMGLLTAALFGDKDIVGHTFTIVGWLLYGVLLGKFYDAFSKNPEARIFDVIKRMVLRK